MMRGPLDVWNAVLDQVAYSPTVIILQLFGSKVALFRDFFAVFWVYTVGKSEIRHISSNVTIRVSSRTGKYFMHGE